MGGSARIAHPGKRPGAFPDDSEGAALALTDSHRARAGTRRDPLALILGADERWDLISIAAGIALAMHVALLVFAIAGAMLKDIHDAVTDSRVRIHDYFFRQYEVEVIKPKEAPPPEPPPSPSLRRPRPRPWPRRPSPSTTILTRTWRLRPRRPARCSRPLPRRTRSVDLTDKGFIDGNGNAVGGQQSTDGKGDRMTMARRTSLNGVEGHHGTAPAPVAPPPPAEDKSRAVQLLGGSANCPFPPEADADQIDQAQATIQITVRPDGSVLSASVLADPGHGFGRAARICMLGKRFQPALDKTGAPTVASIPVHVNFTR